MSLDICINMISGVRFCTLSAFLYQCSTLHTSLPAAVTPGLAWRQCGEHSPLLLFPKKSCGLQPGHSAPCGVPAPFRCSKKGRADCGTGTGAV